MKIGLLTFWDGINFGAFLQTYSLKTFLKDSGFHVQIIPYKGFKHNLIENLYHFKKGLCDRSIRLKISQFKRLQKALLCKQKATNRVNFDEFDTIIFGSDEIWNINNTLFGSDLTYFGGCKFNGKRLAYAPSFGSTNDITNRPDILELLKNFEGISVRDATSKIIIDKNLGTDVNVVLDPTFLINHNVSDDKRKIHGDYIAVYSLTCDDILMKHALTLSKNTGLPLVSIGSTNKKCDYSEANISPFEWYDWIASSQHVVTSMFHGTVFSIIANKQFSLFVEKYRQNKFYPMLERLSLTNCIINSSNFSKGGEIAYHKVDGLLKKWVDESKQWLAWNLNA